MDGYIAPSAPPTCSSTLKHVSPPLIRRQKIRTPASITLYSVNYAILFFYLTVLLILPQLHLTELFQVLFILLNDSASLRLTYVCYRRRVTLCFPALGINTVHLSRLKDLH